MPRSKSNSTQGKISSQAFGSRLHEIRIAKGISEQRFADMIGVQKNYIYVLEKGYRSPSFDTLIAIVRVLNISADMLLKEYLNASVQASVCSSMLEHRMKNLSVEKQAHLGKLLDLEIDYLEKNERL